MTLWWGAWGMRLVGISPVAKLVTIRFGDAADADGRGSLRLNAITEWCCATPDEVWRAIEQLERIGVTWSAEGDQIDFVLPSSGQLPAVAKPPEKILTLYVISGARGTKIGITGDLDKRVAGLRTSMVEDGIRAEWNVCGPASVVRRAERLAHQALASNLVRGEWFSVSVAEGIAAAEAALAAARGEI